MSASGEELELEVELLPLCVECTDQASEVECLACLESFCRPCWESLHRRGKRATHETRPVLGEVMPAPVDEEGELDPAGAQGERVADGDAATHLPSAGSSCESGAPPSTGTSSSTAANLAAMGVGVTQLEGLVEAGRYIPLRLTEKERRLLAVLESSLNVSEYTDKVDVLSRWNKAKTIKHELEFMLSCMSGLAVVGAVGGGEKLLRSGGKDGLDGLASFFRDAFEVGRRYKISNPNRMRAAYGKMMYMLQDSQSSEKILGFSLVRDLRMLTPFLEETGGVGLLRDARIVTATAEGVSVTARQEARSALVAEFTSDRLSEEDICLALDSVRDANAYLTSNVGPVLSMRHHLRTNFHPDKPEGDFTLKISASLTRRALGRFGGSGAGGGFSTFGTGYGGLEYAGVREGRDGGGAKLTHSHSTQFTFVNQSLSLWAEAMGCMYRLWAAADGDLLSGRASYRLLNTGQGLNRVQSCPSVSAEMRRVLATVKSKCGPWVGLSVVHLGDRDVPNALMFIDKYSQIPAMLTPVMRAVEVVDDLMHDSAAAAYINETWGGARQATMVILCDFFKHAFDGSGDDGGSCIDGRITSTWNWCSRIAKKSYHFIFLEAGFHGFNG
jgi:hypothetical protein